MNRFPRLFEPLTIGSRTVKNRIVSTAHATGYDQDGLLTERYVRYHARKAAGGAGLVMAFGSASVHQGSTASYGSVRLWDPANEPLLRDLAGRAHEHGALIMSQATHMGRRGNSLKSGIALQAPSALPEPVHREIPHVLSVAEIEEIVRAFAAAAARLEACGWDGMEITSFGGHLIEQFWSPTINARADRYGGDLEGRLRFSVEVVQAVAAAVSDRFIVGFRMTGDPRTDAVGLSADDMLEIAARLDALGRINLFNISGGTGATLESQAATVPPDTFARGCYNHLGRAMKQRLSVPVLVAGRILDPDQAEEALAAGDCDLVAMTRAIIADPDLPRRAQEGDTGRIRPCIAINEGCIGRLYTGLPILCTVNPGIAHEELQTPAPLSRARRVVVVGGGPAGMEAAGVAAERGHDVTLFERTGRLGGQVLAAAGAPGRPHFGRHVAWLAAELERLRVAVHLDVEATVDTVLSADPEAVIVATGSASVVPGEAADVAAPCITDVDLLEGRVRVAPGARVLVYDTEGYARGGSAAVIAATAGAARVELATPLLSVCEDLDPTQKPSMYRSLARHEVICSPNQVLVGQRNGALWLRDAWSDRERLVEDADLIVFTGYRQAQSGLGDALDGAAVGLEVHLIGDCRAPRRLHDAVAEGAHAGNTV
jgi:2,4-dienoyl-CoA reductase-like NADH-dependent reductase (Old Yellow Enzyme family)